MSELKPCPFCGGEAAVGVTGPFLEGKLMNYAYCENCVCATPAKKTEAEAVAAWNARHVETCRMKDTYSGFVCSSCGFRNVEVHEPSFCPSCGRKVEG